MNLVKDVKVRYIASKVRRACYLFAHSEEAQNFDFFVYADGEYDNSLRGMCAIASFALAETLIKSGIDAYVVSGTCKGYCHCWVVINEKTIVDVTATQFGKDPVHIVDKKDKFYRQPRRIHNYKECEKWVMGQRPSQDTTEYICKIINKELKPTRINKNNWTYDAPIGDYFEL